jgi:RNA polymerase sigma factor (sigma-70 family)
MNAHTQTVRSFAACYAEHHRRIFHLCLRYSGGDQELAADVTQEAFIKLLEHLPNLKQHEDLGGWLYRVATNCALSELRRRRRLFAWLERRNSQSVTAVVSSPDQLAEEREEALHVLETLSTLPPRERIVICMKVLAGKSQAEIAETLSLSEGYVSKLLARAWRRVQEAGWKGGADDDQA